MRELELIDALAPALTCRSDRIVRWIGDDAAVVRAGGARHVTSVDTMVDGVHFHLGHASAADIGHRALAAALSDLAAMGARPGEAYLALVASARHRHGRRAAAGRGGRGRWPRPAARRSPAAT